MWEKKCNRQAGSRIVMILLAIIKTSHSLQIEVTKSYDQNAYRKVHNWQGAWLIANGRGLSDHVHHMVSLPEVFTPVK
jgi:hypothetical protein